MNSVHKLVLALGALALVGCGGGGGDVVESAANLTDFEGPIGSEDIEAGAEVFDTNCSGCHKEDGQGDDLHASNDSPAKVRYIVRNGEGTMPAFDREMISDGELESLLAYLKSEFNMFSE